MQVLSTPYPPAQIFLGEARPATAGRQFYRFRKPIKKPIKIYKNL